MWSVNEGFDAAGLPAPDRYAMNSHFKFQKNEKAPSFLTRL